MGHEFIEASCTSAQTCAKCAAKQGKPLGHKYAEYIVTVDPTCAVTGRKSSTCSVCGATDIQTISKLPHVAGEWVVVYEPTFEKNASD